MNLKTIISDKYELDIIEFEKNEESSDGNVYIINTSDYKYIAKVYSDLNHVNSMIELHNFLNKCGINVPRIIKTIDDDEYVLFEDKYIVLYSFMSGIQVKTYWKNNNHNYDKDILISIAKEIKKFHNKTSGKKFGLNEIEFANKLERKSVVHFDFTKENIFIDNGKISFIDFDDAKYGDSVCDVAIVLSFLFVSKTRGINKEGIDIFLNTYYEDDNSLKDSELPYIKEYGVKWVDYLLDGHEFDTSLTESFLYMKNNIHRIFE